MDWKLGRLGALIAASCISCELGAQTAVFGCIKEGEIRTYVSAPMPPDWECRPIIAKQDERWAEIAKTSNEDPVEVDTRTIARTGTKVTVWIQTWSVFQAAKYRNTSLQRTVSRVEFNCPARTAKQLRTANYYMNGSSSELLLPSDPAGRPVIPGSIEEAELDSLCR